MEGPTPDTLDQSQPAWYLALLAPSTKGPPYSWVEPTRLYMFHEGVQACVADLEKQVCQLEFDVIIGIDAMGFVLASILADRMRKSLQIIRKGGKMNVDVMSYSYVDYTLSEKILEIREDPFPPGSKILIVDQWIESGGTMEAAIKLVEQNKGKVTGIAVICIEGTEGGRNLIGNYPCYQCATPEIQEQLDKKYLKSFGWYPEKQILAWKKAFPFGADGVK